jgi:NADPH:quinone reductase-like Zn-dependent oxidoreductase
MPFILRGMSVLGVSSANCPQQLRRQIWSQLGDTWQPNNMETILAGEISLEELPQTFEKLLTANTQGRYLVKID